MKNIEFEYLSRDAEGNILIKQDGPVTCTSEDGLTSFEIKYEEIDFTCEILEYIVGEKKLIIRLHSNEANKENDLNINKTFTWTDSSTKLFIELYKEKRQLLTNRKIKTKKLLWQTISENMKKNGFNVTVIQAKNKWKSLKRLYKNMITNNKQTGRGRMTCSYETELTELLGYKHNIKPLVVSGKEGTILRADRVNISQTETREKEQNIDTSNHNDATTSLLQDQTGNESSASSASATFTENELPQKTIRKQGNTARVLDKCQKTLDKLTEDIVAEKNAKLNVQNQILDEQKQIRRVYENLANTIKEQLIAANSLRRERNELLRNLLYEKKNEDFI